MADDIDRAQEAAQAFTDAALAKVRRPVVCEAAPAARDCTDCGDPIPFERLQALPSAERCVPCQVLRDGRSS